MIDVNKEGILIEKLTDLEFEEPRYITKSV